MHEELMNCLSHFLIPLPVDSLMVLQMAESTGRLHLVSHMYSLIKESEFVIKSFQILKENESEKHAILCKAEKQNALTLDTLSNVPKRKMIQLTQHFTPNVPYACTVGKMGLPWFWHTVEVFMRQNSTSSPQNCVQIIQDLERLAIRDGPFWSKQDNKCSEAWDSTGRSPPKSPKSKQHWPFREKEVYFVVIGFFFFSFLRKLEIFRGQCGPWRLDGWVWARWQRERTSWQRGQLRALWGRR